MTTRLMIVAETRLYREALADALCRERQLQAIDTVGSADELLGKLADSPPDVALIDMAIPRGHALCRIITVNAPMVKVVALAIEDTEADVVACAEAGAAAFVRRDASLSDLLLTINSVMDGELPCSPRAAAALMRRVAVLAAERRPKPVETRLTSRELEILRLIDDGLSNKEIARRLTIELPTVKNHVHSILEKLGVRRRFEAAAQIRRQHLSASAEN